MSNVMQTLPHFPCSDDEDTGHDTENLMGASITWKGAGQRIVSFFPFSFLFLSCRLKTQKKPQYRFIIFIGKCETRGPENILSCGWWEGCTVTQLFISRPVLRMVSVCYQGGSLTLTLCFEGHVLIQ